MSEIITPALGGASDIGTFTRQVLEGVEFRLGLLWLAEEVNVPFQPDPGPPPLVFDPPGVWSLTLAESDGTILVAGQILREGVNVLAPFRGDSRFPGGGQGKLGAIDLSRRGRDPGRDDLVPGSDVRLCYQTAAEAMA